MYARKGLSIKPIIHGGGQERNKRAGTENLYGIIGMAKAMELAYEHLESERTYILELKNYFYQKLVENFGVIQINGPKDFNNSLYTVLNVSFPPDPRGSLLLFNLDMEGLCVSGGSACTSGASSGSHVINAISNELDRVSIRFSFSKYNTKEELDFALEKVLKVFNVKVKC
ncbi:MAG: aminotransferase class V-fold PLP-dependent enzyme [Chitinophagales bacterium]